MRAWRRAWTTAGLQKTFQCVYFSLYLGPIPNSDLQQFGTVRGSINGHANVLDTFVPIHRSSSPSHHVINERSPSPAQGDYIIAHEDTTQHETHYSEPPSNSSATPGVVNINVHTPHGQPAGDDGGVSAAVSAQLQSKYVEAQDEIARLKALVANLADASQKDTGLRRRTRAFTDDGSYVADSVADDETVFDRPTGGSVSTSSQEAGVPLQVVIIIALGVFVTTYLFF